MRPFAVRTLFTTIALTLVVSSEITGMHASGLGALVGTALLLGVLNALVRPILLLLSAPFIVVTLGLFILVINAVMLAAAGSLVPGFYVGGFGNAFLGAALVSLVSWGLSLVFRGPDGKVHWITHHHVERSAGLAPAEPKPVQGRVVE